MLLRILLRRVRDPILESRRQVAALNEDESTVPIGFVGQADFRIRPAPAILLIEPPHHLSGNALDRPIGAFEKLQHLAMSVRAAVANGDACKLGIDSGEL